MLVKNSAAIGDLILGCERRGSLGDEPFRLVIGDGSDGEQPSDHDGQDRAHPEQPAPEPWRCRLRPPKSHLSPRRDANAVAGMTRAGGGINPG
jgi:hypothetical protein